MTGNDAKKQGEKNQKLLDWLNELPKPTQDMLAGKMGTSTGQLRQIAHGARNCSVRLAVEIDKYSGGRVTMTELAPSIDWEHVKLFIHARPTHSEINAVAAA